ncbi:hypothetical protein PSE10A_54110 [Pseudomonas amygdali pv. eriobotryae]|uniref:Uncharacterized protein n=1 Tax=Pseudomonas amygdali pv. eriobotryae TaxID=129137 RepID=A0A9P3EFG9_PSEA0|nr:hypothetical protein PSE10A_54110 [Pseudomonas amygdali pv. eriobotryae]
MSGANCSTPIPTLHVPQSKPSAPTALPIRRSVAQALVADPLTLLVLAYAAERDQTPQQVLDHLAGDFAANGLKGSEIPSLSKVLGA